MKGLALLGCIVLLLFLCFVLVCFLTLLFCIDGQKDERDEREFAYWMLIGTFVIVVSSFIIFPERFGYEKVSTVSENVIESEG